MQLKPYDIILCKGNRNIISKLICKFTQDQYSHAELYIGNYHIIDDMPNGVKIREMDRQLGKFDAYRYYKPITKAQKEKIDEFLQKALNSKYDMKELLLQAFKKKDKKDENYICITLILEAFKYAGLKVGRFKQGFKQVSNSKYFYKIN